LAAKASTGEVAVSINNRKHSTLVPHLERLVGSLALDENFQRDFLQDPLGAIQRFNREFAPRYCQKPVVLTEDELKLITALKVTTIKEFITLVAIITAAGGSATSSAH
jgi:hypothetical protein